jgi:hypothetical protein
MPSSTARVAAGDLHMAGDRPVGLVLLVGFGFIADLGEPVLPAVACSSRSTAWALIRTTWTFKSSSGRCAHLRRVAEAYPQVLISFDNPEHPLLTVTRRICGYTKPAPLLSVSRGANY